MAAGGDTFTKWIFGPTALRPEEPQMYPTMPLDSAGVAVTAGATH